MLIARTCDDRVDELKAQHASAITAKEIIIARMETQHAAAIAALEGQVAALQAQTVSKLTHIETAVAALHTLEIHPVRSDRRQFAEWHAGPMPASPGAAAPVTFDRDWCDAFCRKFRKWKATVDVATGTSHAEVAVTWRFAAPHRCRAAPRRPASPAACPRTALSSKSTADVSGVTSASFQATTHT
jgi:hypothetical protein